MDVGAFVKTEGYDQPDWDACGAEPVTEAAIQAAQRFVDRLPEDITPPDLGAEPDGVVTMDWYTDRDHTINVSVNPDDSVDYAAIVGNEHPYGHSDSDSDAIPARVLVLIRRVMGLGGHV